MDKLDNFLIAGYLPTIGVEVHVQLKTKSKMFCACKLDMDEVRPNSNICPICLGLPGSLPAVNKAALDLAIRFGLAVDAEIDLKSSFDRKNYFYPDLPKSYQITQLFQPICQKGKINIISNDKVYQIDLERAHLEEDAAKLTHPPGKNYSLVDFNRAGSPLLEVVSSPTLHSSSQAKAFLEMLHLIVVSQGISEGSMQKGQFKFDLNVSIAKPDSKELGVKVELKNLNSFRYAKLALDFEIERQIQVLKQGGSIRQQTRGYDETSGQTMLQRYKEEAMDYRYFPEPDLPSLDLESSLIEEQRAKLRTLPIQVIDYLDKLKITSSEISTLLSDADLYWLMNKLLESSTVSEALAKQLINILLSDFIYFKNQNPSLITSDLNLDTLIEVAQSLLDDKISSKIFKQIAGDIFSGKTLEEALQKHNLILVSDDGQIQIWIDQAIENNPKAWQDYLAGNSRALGAIIGKIMSYSSGQANPKIINKLLLAKAKSR